MSRPQAGRICRGRPAPILSHVLEQGSLPGKRTMTPDILKRLRLSIKDRRCAVLRYDSQQHIRVVEPHVIYTDAEGSVVVGCFQTRGPGNPAGDGVTWQRLLLSKIESVFLLDIGFNARIEEGFKPDHPAFQKGLIAVVATAVPGTRATRGGHSPNVLWHQARGWLWDMGSAIDRVLSDRKTEPGDR